MRERIFSLETEYAISFQPEGENNPPGSEKIVEALRKPLVAKCGIPNSAFLLNGSKFYYDSGHAEWSLPECRSAYEAAVYDKAADHVLGTLVPEAEQQLAQWGYHGRLLVVKNNADTTGNTYGCHENYMTESETDWLGREDHLRLTVRYLIPFLVTRQVFCGAGRVGFGPNLKQGFGFQIMQRADFIEVLVSKETREDRALVNIGRENESLASGNYRRLHLILADANLSGWATYMKLGTMGILLRMLEDLRFGNIPHLADPIAALRQISRDLSCKTRVCLRDGREATAIEIQRLYLEQAQTYFKTYEASPEEQELMQLWEETLNTLERDPSALWGKVDWVTKKYLLDCYLKRIGLSWSNELREQPVYYELLRMDIQYHNLFSQDGLFYGLLRGRLDTWAEDAKILQAEAVPPPYTRARIRGDMVELARSKAAYVDVDSWERVVVNDQSIGLGFPLEFFSPEIYSGLQKRMTQEKIPHQDALPELEKQPSQQLEPEVAIIQQSLQKALTHIKKSLEESNLAIRCQSLRFLGEIGSQEHVAWILPFLCSKEQSSLRLAAIEALGMIGSSKAIEALVAIQADDDLAVRWKTQEVLDLLGRGKRLLSPPRPKDSQGNSLITLIS